MIYCFSGTGNSRYVARCLGQALDQKITNIDAASLLRPERFHCADEVTVWVFPVHSWGLPKVVGRFMRDMPAIAGRHYMVCTCGDDIGLAHKQWRKLVERYHGSACGAYSVQMPNTYVLLPGFDVDSDEVEREKLGKCKSRIDYVASRIAGGYTGDDVVKGGLPWLKSRVIYPLFMAFMTSPRPFKVDRRRCVGCGRCVARCPMFNVHQDKAKRPMWGDNCAFCMACYHACPSHAVAYGRRTKKKGQYNCPLR